MAQYYYRVIHMDTDKGNAETDITNAVDIEINEGIEATVDTFRLMVDMKNLPDYTSNNSYLGDFGINVEDGIKIYFGESPNPTTLVMDGKVTEFTVTLNERGRIYKITGQNKLESLMNNVRPAAFPDYTASEIVSNLIDQVNSMHGDNWVDIGKTITPTTLEFDYNRSYKSIFQQIEEVSRHEFTGNGTFVFYLDASNNFVWKPRPTTVTTKLTEGVDAIDITIIKGTWDVVNAMIIHAGDDLNGSPIYAMAHNATSIGKIGFKWKYVAYTEMAKEYIKNNPGADNNTVRSAVYIDARKTGDSILNRLGSPRYKVDFEIRGDATFTKGDLLELEIKSGGWIGDNIKIIRLTDIVQRFSAKNGWTTKLHFEEDEETALAELGIS